MDIVERLRHSADARDESEEHATRKITGPDIRKGIEEIPSPPSFALSLRCI
jgi:hypothetical protein